MLGSVLAGAALLRDKGRRNRVFGQARDLFAKLKAQASEMANTGTSANGASASGYGAYDDAGFGRSRTY